MHLSTCILKTNIRETLFEHKSNHATAAWQAGGASASVVLLHGCIWDGFCPGSACSPLGWKYVQVPGKVGCRKILGYVFFTVMLHFKQFQEAKIE